MKKVVILLGPTAVGKSEFGIILAKKFNGEIISADSVQVYKGLDIGSAKLKKEEMQGVEHHFIDILPPQSEFSVFDFVEMTKQKIDEIIKRGKLPFIVGGTGLYIKALLNGYDFGGAGKQKDFREALEKEAEKNLESLYERLKERDASLAGKIKPTDKKRIIRALEILEFGKQPKENGSDLDAKVFCLNLNREKLYTRINLRAESMLSSGLVEEVKGLLDNGVSPENQSMKAIGYKEVIGYLNGEFDKFAMKELIKQHSRNYAKRQLTFFRGLKEIKFVDVEGKNQALVELEKEIKEWL